jgi:hypothetical protein
VKETAVVEKEVGEGRWEWRVTRKKMAKEGKLKRKKTKSKWKICCVGPFEANAATSP